MQIIYGVFMKLHILGFGPPYPNKGRATSSFILETTSAHLLIDCGHGAASKLLEYVSLRDLTAVIISHMHPDHFYDLIPLRNSFFNEKLGKVSLYLPPGGLEILQDVVKATRLPDTYMTDYFKLIEYDPDHITVIGDLQIRMKQTIHPINTYAMSFRKSSDKSFVYTSDTAWSEQLIDFCKEADLLLIEATEYPPLNTVNQRWHLTPQEAGAFIEKARVKKAILTHYEMKYSRSILSFAREKSPQCQIFLAEEHEEYEI
jgi:ribonuclease BN (tRNA processing enzyme)